MSIDDTEARATALQTGVAAQVATYSRLLAEQGVPPALLTPLVVAYQQDVYSRALEAEAQRQQDEANARMQRVWFKAFKTQYPYVEDAK